jgi:hypothetical protein
MSVYDYVFGADHKLSVQELPAETSLQKKVKQLYLQGGIIRDTQGVIFR